jgi:hypothetical protein
MHAMHRMCPKNEGLPPPALADDRQSQHIVTSVTEQMAFGDNQYRCQVRHRCISVVQLDMKLVLSQVIHVPGCEQKPILTV